MESGSRSIHAKRLNTPRAITNTTGQLVWSWANDDPFGANVPNENPSGAGAFTCNLRLPGQYFDKETSIHYNIFRDYEPAIGRYIQSDPIGLRGGINTYAYVNASPIAFSDELGLKVEVRCRTIGHPYNPDFRSRAAAILGGEHCFVVASCPGVTNGVTETTVSYLADGMTITPRGGSHTNDTIYSQQGRYRVLDVLPPPGGCKDGDSCKFEKCIVTMAENLKYMGYRVPNYSPFGTNSNSVARGLVEACGGKVFGSGPITGWRNSGSVGF